MVALAPEEREPITVTGLRVEVDEPVGGLEKLNRELEEAAFLCYAIEGSSHRVQQEYNLDSFFFMYDVSDIKDTYSLALGLNGLYLHCHVVERAELARSFGVAPPEVFTDFEAPAIQSE
jgi:CRISPR-associated endonuclease/helicase Cas3